MIESCLHMNESCHIQMIHFTWYMTREANDNVIKTHLNVTLGVSRMIESCLHMNESCHIQMSHFTWYMTREANDKVIKTHLNVTLGVSYMN